MEYKIKVGLSKTVRIRSKLNETKIVCNDVVCQS